MNRKLRVMRCFLVMGILILGLTLGMTCRKHDNPPYSFTVTFGGPGEDWGNAVQQTSDGGYVITGRTASYGAGGSDVWLIKTDANGDKAWDKTFGGTGDDEGNSVQQTADGGYIITGMTDSAGAGRQDVLLLKTNESGDAVWEKTFRGASEDAGYSVRQTTDGGYIITGGTYSYGSAPSAAWLIKTDALGNELWDRKFGGSSYSEGHSVEQTTDGGYIIAGFTSVWATGYFYVWLVRTDSDGNKVWDRTYGSTGADLGYSVHQTTDGGYIVTGRADSSSGLWLIKTDTAGNEVWDGAFTGGGEDEGHSVQQTSDGGYIVAGSTRTYLIGRADIMLVKTDASGKTVWQKTFGGTGLNECWSVGLTSDAGCILSGYVNSSRTGDDDVLLIKTDADGN